jgi:LmbE family N-acetylglucosaminyl deacetylase
VIALPLGREVRHVLCLGAHCDDIEIGCGGTLTALARSNPAASFSAVVFSASEIRLRETRAALENLLGPAVRFGLITHDHRDGFFPAQWAAIKDSFEALKRLPPPDLVFTHFERDRHQDHRIICELTANTFRDQLVLEYEIPKYDGDVGRPSVFAPLQPADVDRKVATLLSEFPSQLSRHWFTEDIFRGLMRLRGMECNSPSGYAEAFYSRKLALAL